MAEVTKPVLLDETGQRIADALEQLNASKIIVGTEGLMDNAPLPTGTLYIQVADE